MHLLMALPCFTHLYFYLTFATLVVAIVNLNTHSCSIQICSMHFMYLSTNTSTIVYTKVQVEVHYDKLIFNNNLIITLKFTLQSVQLAFNALNKHK